jgi:hypothetical protein
MLRELLRHISIFFWICIFGGVCQELCIAQQDFGAYTNLADYLTNRAWISDLTYKGPITPKGESLFKASLQPDGFYLQCLTKAPYGGKYIYSESTSNYWVMSSNTVETAFKSKILGGSPTNHAALLSAYMRRQVIDILNFGIANLDNSNIAWVSPNEFTSPFLDEFGERTSGKIDVRVESLTNNLPAELHCMASTAEGSIEYDISCHYEKPVLPPWQFIVKIQRGGSVQFITNVINNIVFGVRNDSVEEFGPWNFFSTASMPKRQLLDSNSLVYIQTNDVLQLFDRSVNAGVVRPHSSIQLEVRVALISMIFLPLAIIIYKLLKAAVNKKTHIER